jgi:5'(3')-deoxyribonucleotidase
MDKKKIIFIDMDDTIADFDGVFKEAGVPCNEFEVHKMYEPGFFFKLKPLPGALAGVRALMRLGYDIHILTQPVAESAHSYSEKVQWISLHFPDLVSKVHMTQNKGLFVGDYLIDDNERKWKEKFEANGGKFIHFVHSNRHMWDYIVQQFKDGKF